MSLLMKNKGKKVAEDAEHRDGYEDILRQFNKLTNAYYDVERAVPSELQQKARRIYTAMSEFHDALKNWDR